MECSKCVDQATGEDGLCDDCREILAEQFSGAMCVRCDIELNSTGYCPNCRCPFHVDLQDELVAGFDYPDANERLFIEQEYSRK